MVVSDGKGSLAETKGQESLLYSKHSLFRYVECFIGLHTSNRWILYRGSPCPGAQFSLSSLLCAITESIKHPYETLWTSVDTQTVVKMTFSRFCYYHCQIFSVQKKKIYIYNSVMDWQYTRELICFWTDIRIACKTCPQHKLRNNSL